MVSQAAMQVRLVLVSRSNTFLCFLFLVFCIFYICISHQVEHLGVRTPRKGGNIYIFELANLLDKVLHAGELLPLAHVVKDNTMKTI